MMRAALSIAALAVLLPLGAAAQDVEDNGNRVFSLAYGRSVADDLGIVGRLGAAGDVSRSFGSPLTPGCLGDPMALGCDSDFAATGNHGIAPLGQRPGLFDSLTTIQLDNHGSFAVGMDLPTLVGTLQSLGLTAPVDPDRSASMKGVGGNSFARR